MLEVAARARDVVLGGRMDDRGTERTKEEREDDAPLPPLHSTPPLI
jgi:hypothetical protein